MPDNQIALPAMFVASWGNLAAFMVEIISHAPELSPRLMYASPVAFHCYGAYLRLCGSEKLTPEALALQLMRSPAELLKEALPESTADLMTAFKLLDEPGVLTARSYLRLDAAVRGPTKDALLASSHLTMDLLNQVEQLVAFDPLVSAATTLVVRNPEIAPSLHATLVLLRAANALGDEDLARQALRSIDEEGFKAFVLSRLAHAQAPPCPFTVGPSLRLIRSVAMLREVVGRLQPSKFTPLIAELALVRGNAIFIELLGEEPGLFMLMREPFEIISIGRCFGQYGIPLSNRARAQVLSELHGPAIHKSPVRVCAALGNLFEGDIISEFGDVYLEFLNTEADSG